MYFGQKEGITKNYIYALLNEIKVNKCLILSDTLKIIVQKEEDT